MSPSNSYDLIRYPTHPQQRTHPDYLAVLAHLSGLVPEPPEKCRVLELGGGDGGNLIAIALTLPGSEFVGLDLAAEPVERGRRMIAELGLNNIRLLQMDLMDVGPDLGEFDYIIAHGIYAWVPPAVRDKVMAIARANLSPHGVAFVSYNAHPTGHFREVLRAAIMWHARGLEEPRERLARAREILKVLAQGRKDAGDLERALQKEASVLLAQEDWAIYHDNMAEFYAPAYLHQVAAHAASHGLQYLCDASVVESLNLLLQPDAPALIRDGAGEDWVAAEQYIDLLRLRKFRQSLLCHGERLVERRWRPESVDGLWVASHVKEEAREDGKVDFLVPAITLTTEQAPVVALLRRLAAIWPQAERIARADAQLALWLFTKGMAELRASPSPAARAGGQPLASPLARMQAARGENNVGSLLHQRVEVEGEERLRLLPMLDGTRTRDALCGEMRITRPALDEHLDALAWAGLLVG